MDEDGASLVGPDDLELLGRALAALRKRTGKSGRDVAGAMGCSASVISRYEQGQRDLSIRSVLRYLRVVNASLVELHNTMEILRMLRAGEE